MENFITIAKKILLSDLPHDGVFVDYTMTDGYDTLYMAKFVSEGNIITFAKDKNQVDSAYKLFESNFQDNAHIIMDNPVNVEKYVNSDINGFLLDAVNVPMEDDMIIELIRASLAIMKRHKKGMITLNRYNTKAIEFIENMLEDRVSVLEMSMANINSPKIFIIEKIV